jgi:serine/threonine protein kinase
MTPELYQRINQLVQSALDRPEDERVAFLDSACGSDIALRGRVEALIAAYEQSGDFLDTPAYEMEASTLSQEASGSLLGRHVGRYQVLSIIGKGGMGTVYLAHDVRLDRKVALKVLPRELTNDELRAGRFRREARAGSALNHPNIVTIYELDEADGVHFIATEYVEGMTLRQRLKDGPLKLDAALDIVLQVAGALSRAHNRGIIHRDVKPENIMLCSNGQVKVLDFGLAKFTSLPEEDSTQTAYTTPGLILGTIAYMSPEQARGLEVDARADIWSLGVVLYELLTASKPFTGPTRADTLAAILERAPEALDKAPRPELPDEVKRILVKALRKNLSERYQSVEEFASDLREIQRVSSPRTGVRRTVVMVSVVLLALTLLTAAIVWFFSFDQGPSPPLAAAKPQRSLSYTLLVQKYRDGKPFEEPFTPTADINFEPDYRVRLQLSSEQAGHLYVLNEQLGTSPDAPVYKVLFPSPTANGGDSRIETNRQLQIPEQSWFRFDENRGAEKVWLVWSAQSVPALEAVKGFANERDRGVIKSSELNKTVHDFLTAARDPAPVAERVAGQKEVVIRASGDILAHLLRLEHH